ncbi:hypothetical protein [Lentzea sp. NPDC092896]|uniref:hypothetical protein n=1 Tax=Lentzea sp. NPDC092896 TaxID=3364127 RepID=UPI0038304CBA
MTAARRRALPAALVLGRPHASWKLWVRCLEGREPAESLPTRDREDLVWHLVHELGWLDAEVAAHTQMTEYTTARIRERLGLQPNAVNDITAAA